jgi:IS5 family transposase
VIDKCSDIAEKAGVKQRQKYKKESKQLLRDTYNGHHPRRIKKSKKAKKRLRTIANTQLREPDKKLTVEQKAFYREQLALYKRAVNQQKTDKNKVYSLHGQFTRSICQREAASAV